MGDVARPMLAEVLAVLTELPADVWAPALGERSPGWCVRPVLDAIHGVRFDLEVPGATVGAGPRASWLHTSPAEAQETLVARGVLPEGWCQDVRRGWLAWLCAEERAGRPCDCNRGSLDAVHLDAPRTIPDLVAVASLGWTAIDCAEELARAARRALREYGCPQPERVVWRVGERDASYVALYESGGYADGVMLYADGSCEWSNEYGAREDIDVPSGVALWEMGLALDAIDRDAVRIAVPPVGGGRG